MAGAGGWFPDGLVRRPLAVLDFEASRLPGPGSYPIEVAVVHEDGRSASWLIRPEPSWLSRGVWDPKSEAVHGIARAALDADGLAAADAAARLLRELEGCCPVGGHAADQDWLDMLVSPSGLNAPLLTVMDEFYYGWLAGPGNYSEEALAAIGDMQAAADAAYPRRHRALPDACRLMHFLKALMAAEQDFGADPGSPSL